jgi:NMD protein affecting ribosome stability and mRNA decay
MEDVMRSDKRYSNVSFTKRVDHNEGPRHGTRAHKEPSVCSRCGAVYANRRWVLGSEAAGLGADREWSPAETVICPACKKTAAGHAGGFVNLTGDFLANHHDEILRLIRNEAMRAAVDNPLGRIMKVDDTATGSVKITTTTEHLAKRLGDAVEKAYGGDLRVDFSHENKLARVYWSRS